MPSDHPCGTPAYERHVRGGEEPCDPCRDAARAEWGRACHLTTPMDETNAALLLGTRNTRGEDSRRAIRAGRPVGATRMNATGRRASPHDPVRLVALWAGTASTSGSGSNPVKSAARRNENMNEHWVGSPSSPAECGTRSGYRRHRRLGEQACEPCLAAMREHAKPRRYWRQTVGETRGDMCPLRPAHAR